MKLERFIRKTKVSSGTKYNKLITYIIVLADIKTTRHQQISLYPLN